MKTVFMVVGLFCLMGINTRAEALILINEFLADPPSGLSGDANGDGVGSTSQDEFIELYNPGNLSLNLSGWSIHDALRERHLFPQNTELNPLSTLVIFGGGAPTLADVDWQTASGGSLGLNNGGDTISLFDLSGGLIDQVTYGSEGGKDQSLVRLIEGSDSEFILHSEHGDAQDRLFSPGAVLLPLVINEPPIPDDPIILPGDEGLPSAAVPEPSTVIGFLSIIGAALARKKTLIDCG